MEKKETFTNAKGTEIFARLFFDLQKEIPQSRYIEPEERKEQKIPAHISQYLEILELWNLNKGEQNGKSRNN